VSKPTFASVTEEPCTCGFLEPLNFGLRLRGGTFPTSELHSHRQGMYVTWSHHCASFPA